MTIDAMGCQKEIAKKIRRGGGAYVLAVKDNQPKLYQAIHEFFVEALEDDLGQLPHRRHETHDKGHGRMDYRYYYLAKLPDDFALKKQWPGIKAIGMAVRITHTPSRQLANLRSTGFYPTSVRGTNCGSRAALVYCKPLH